MSPPSPDPIARPRRSAFDWSTAVIVALALGAAATVLVRSGSDRFFAILREDAELFFEILPKVLAGTLIGAFVTLLLPREIVSRWVGSESGLMGILIATLVGIIFPGGPFTIYPVAAALIAVGADAGAAVAFMTSWTLLGYTRVIVWEMPFFGFDFVLWRLVVALPLPIVAGLLARAALKAFSARREPR